MERNERLERNPLKSVGKSEIRGQERYVRRALTQSELATLIQKSGKRAVPYMLGELEKLTPALPSLPASPNCGKSGLEAGVFDQTKLPKKMRVVS